MASFWLFILKLVLCLVCLTVAFDHKTESVIKGGQKEPLDLEQKLNRLLRDIEAVESEFDKSESTLEKEKKVDVNVESKGKETRSMLSNEAKRFNSRRRCLLGHPYDCPMAFTEFPTPWGWPPGPFYPEYGPNFLRGCAGHGGLFGYNHGGCVGLWRGPGCRCGCNNHGWVCCGGGGGGPANDCPQCNDAPSKAPLSPQRPSQPGNPPLLQPMMGKQANFKAPIEVKPGKAVRRGYKRFGVPYNTGYQNTYQPNYGNYPYQPSYGNYPYQPSYGSDPYQSGYGNDPYQSGYGNDPYQSNCGNWPCPTTQQPPSETDQVVGNLFLFKPSDLLADKKPQRKSKN